MRIGHRLIVAAVSALFPLLAHAEGPPAVNPAVTQATIDATICRPGWTASVRPPVAYTDRIKRSLAREQGVDPRCCELDHVTPLALGGAPRDPRNLRLQPWPEARIKDEIEVCLARAVCAGRIDRAGSYSEHTTVITNVKRPPGRPSTYTPDIEEIIITGLIEGRSLIKICDAANMPNRRTVLRWMEADAGFATRCARARALQADLMDDKIIDLINETTSENAHAMKVKLSAIQWRAAKLEPKKYGERVQTELSGSVNVTSHEQALDELE